MSFLVSAAFSWYGFIIGMGMLVCIFAAYYLAKRRGYNADLVFTIAVICLPAAILGARIYYIVFDIIGGDNTFSDWFLRNDNFSLMKFVGFSDDGNYDGLAGLAIYGGLIGATLGAIIVRLINKRDKNPKNHMTYIQLLDAFFVLVILGQAIGRWGNFANDEAYGNAVTNPNLQWFPYAYESSRAGGWVQATFFWESALNVIGFLGLLYLCYGKKRRSYDGFVFSGYCIWYGLVRLIVEGQRSDSLYTSGGFNTVIGVMLLIVAVGLVAYTIVPLIIKSRRELAAGGVQAVGKIGYKDLLPCANLLMFAFLCLIIGLVLIFGDSALRISQLVSGLLIAWGTTNIGGHIINAKTSGKRIFIHAKMSDLGLDYYGYEKTIMYINSAGTRDSADVAEQKSDSPSAPLQDSEVRVTNSIDDNQGDNN